MVVGLVSKRQNVLIFQLSSQAVEIAPPRQILHFYLRTLFLQNLQISSTLQIADLVLILKIADHVVLTEYVEQVALVDLAALGILDILDA